MPIACSGVQAVPKTLHSQGLITPFSTSPHWQAFGIGDADARAPRSAARRRSRRRPRASLQRALGDEAEAAPLEVRPQLEHLGHHLERRRVALVGDDAPVLVLDLAAALGELAQDHLDRLEDVERLEAGDDQRLAVVGGDELERARADDGRRRGRGR